MIQRMMSCPSPLWPRKSLYLSAVPPECSHAGGPVSRQAPAPARQAGARGPRQAARATGGLRRGTPLGRSQLPRGVQEVLVSPVKGNRSSASTRAASQQPQGSYKPASPSTLVRQESAGAEQRSSRRGARAREDGWPVPTVLFQPRPERAAIARPHVEAVASPADGGPAARRPSPMPGRILVEVQQVSAALLSPRRAPCPRAGVPLCRSSAPAPAAVAALQLSPRGGSWRPPPRVHAPVAWSNPPPASWAMAPVLSRPHSQDDTLCRLDALPSAWPHRATVGAAAAFSTRPSLGCVPARMVSGAWSSGSVVGQETPRGKSRDSEVLRRLEALEQVCSRQAATIQELQTDRKQHTGEARRSPPMRAPPLAEGTSSGAAQQVGDSATGFRKAECDSTARDDNLRFALKRLEHLAEAVSSDGGSPVECLSRVSEERVVLGSPDGSSVPMPTPLTQEDAEVPLDAESACTRACTEKLRAMAEDLEKGGSVREAVRIWVGTAPLTTEKDVPDVQTVHQTPRGRAPAARDTDVDRMVDRKLRESVGQEVAGCFQRLNVADPFAQRFRVGHREVTLKILEGVLWICGEGVQPVRMADWLAQSHREFATADNAELATRLREGEQKFKELARLARGCRAARGGS